MRRSTVNGRPVAKRAARRTLASGRRVLVWLALFLPMTLASVPVPAQEAKAAQPAHRVAPRNKRKSLDERVELLARYLDLNQGQTSTLKNILLERQQKILAMRHGPSQGEELQVDRFRAIEDRTVERIRAMLTEEQRKKYDPLGARNSNSASQNVSVESWLKEIGPR